jgi:hypothetical protein
VANIYISYRRADSAYVSRALYDRLERNLGRSSLFMDVDSIQLGVDFIQALEKQVDHSDILIVVIGRDWLTTTDQDGRRRLDDPGDFVRIEIASALSKGKVVIPVLVDGASMPRPEDLPPELRSLARRNSFEVSHVRFDSDIARLVRELQRILADREQSAQKPEGPTRSRTETEIDERITRLARIAATERDLGQLDEHVDRLPDGTIGVLSDIPKLRSMVQELVLLQRRLEATQRPAFQEPIAEQLVTKIENFWHRVGGLKEPLASEYRIAALAWQSRASEQLEQIRGLLARAPKPQVFRAGDPVDRSNEAFVPRMKAIDLLERQITLAQGCPGLLVYGRRRMGKSTLFQNLNGFLPPSVLVSIVSMQNPHAFSSQQSLIGVLLRSAWSSVGDDSSQPTPNNLQDMFTALDMVNSRLAKNGKRLLLACDEFEMIDQKIGEQVFSIDLLHTLRESIQKHRRIIWTFVGSRSLGELAHAEWPSFFVSLRTVEVTPFSADETLLLLTEPLKYSLLWKRPEDTPRFTSFWGTDGIKRIHAETGGWPHLVQLVAETCVDLANDAGVESVDATLLERAFDESVRRGDAVLRQLIEGESCLPGEAEYLMGFRDRESQPEPADPEVRRALRRRQLVVVDGGVWLLRSRSWRLRTPLMRRWMATNG